jgi:hypothetical protein
VASGRSIKGFGVAGSIAAVVCCLLLPATSQAETTVVSCPTGGGGDQITRGFYLSNYQGSNLGAVTLKYYPLGDPTIPITLTARAGTYDGPVIGAVTMSVSPPATVRFDFGGVPVAKGSTITFAHSVGSNTNPDGFAFVDYGEGTLGGGGDACPGVMETEGTTPPLDSDRRESMGVTVTEYPPSPSPSPSPSGGSGEDPKCKKLRKKRKRQGTKLAAATGAKRDRIQRNIKDTGQRKRKLHCE